MANLIETYFSDSKKFERLIERLYGSVEGTIAKQKSRYNQLIERFNKLFPGAEAHFFNTPGRIEIGGNHTDHNNGRILTASINLDSICIATPTKDRKITVYSEGYPEPFIVNLEQKKPRMKESGSTAALIRGIAARLDQLGFTIGGFQAVISSAVRVGSGLSSSASFEVLIASILNHLYNDGKISSERLAQIGQFAENVYFNKPCGLMDQLACALGGIISIDFEDPQIPIINRVDFDFNRQEYCIVVVDTGGNDFDLHAEYAAIPQEMESVAQTLGGEVCRDISYEQIIESFDELRSQHGDRALLRCLHFFWENERVGRQVKALEINDFQKFLGLVTDSGNSSFRWLQNCYSAQNLKHQGISLALSLTEQFLKEINAGACRVHGGGFTGTILTFIPREHVKAYQSLMDSVFGADSAQKLLIRYAGTLYLNNYF